MRKHMHLDKDRDTCVYTVQVSELISNYPRNVKNVSGGIWFTRLNKDKAF